MRSMSRAVSTVSIGAVRAGRRVAQARAMPGEHRASRAAAGRRRAGTGSRGRSRRRGVVPHCSGPLAPVPRGSKLTTSVGPHGGGEQRELDRQDLVAALAGTARIDDEGPVGRRAAGRRGPGHGDLEGARPTGGRSRAGPARSRTGRRLGRAGRPGDRRRGCQGGSAAGVVGGRRGRRVGDVSRGDRHARSAGPATDSAGGAGRRPGRASTDGAPARAGRRTVLRPRGRAVRWATRWIAGGRAGRPPDVVRAAPRRGGSGSAGRPAPPRLVRT